MAEGRQQLLLNHLAFGAMITPLAEASHLRKKGKSFTQEMRPRLKAFESGI